MNSTLQAFRIHNDIPFDWEVLRNDAPENLSDADVEVYLINPSGGKTKIDYTLTGNTVHGCSYGKEQYIIGVYRLVLTSTRGASKNTYDIKAWQLVPHSWMEGGKAPDGLVTKPVHFTSNITTPANGIGIQEISTTSSDADEGVNTVTILLDSGRTYSFEVKNGSKGSTPNITATKEGLVTTLYTDGVPFATLNDANVTECNEAIARINKSIKDADSAVTAANKAVEDNTKAVNDKIEELNSAMSKAENVNASYDKETGIITITDREGNIRQIEVGKSSMIVKVTLTSEKNGTADKTQNEIANHMLNGGEAYWLIESTGTLCKISSYENFLTGIYTRNHNEFCTLEQRSNRVSFEYHDTNSIKSYNDLKDKPADTRFIFNVAVEVSDILANRATPSAMGRIHNAINNRYVVSVNNYGAQVLLMNCNSAGSSVHFDILSDGNTYHIEISSRYTYTVSRINNVKTIELTFEDGETIPAIVKSGNNTAPSFPYVFDYIYGNFLISHHTFGLYIDEDGNSHFALIFCILHNNINASIPFIRYVVYLYDESKAAMVFYDKYTEDSAPEWVLDIVSEKSDAGVDLTKYQPGDTVPFAQYYYMSDVGNDYKMELPLTHSRIFNNNKGTFLLFCVSHDDIDNEEINYYAVLKINDDYSGLEYLSDYNTSDAPAWLLKAFNENLASSELDGLMSKTDKTNLDTLIGTPIGSGSLGSAVNNQVISRTQLHPNEALIFRITAGDMMGTIKLINRINNEVVYTHIAFLRRGTFAYINTEVGTQDIEVIADGMTFNGAKYEIVITGATAEAISLLAPYLERKVDKENGKGLSTNDFTTALKNKLESLENYNDNEVRGLIDDLKGTLDKLMGSQDTTAVIDTFNEIIAFLENFKNDKSLASVLSTLKSELQTWVEQQYATKSEVSRLDSKVGELSELDDAVKAESFAQAINKAAQLGGGAWGLAKVEGSRLILTNAKVINNNRLVL